jgi:hypothetical protein
MPVAPANHHNFLVFQRHASAGFCPGTHGAMDGPGIFNEQSPHAGHGRAPHRSESRQSGRAAIFPVRPPYSPGGPPPAPCGELSAQVLEDLSGGPAARRVRSRRPPKPKPATAQASPASRGGSQLSLALRMAQGVRWKKHRRDSELLPGFTGKTRAPCAGVRAPWRAADPGW